MTPSFAEVLDRLVSAKVNGIRPSTPAEVTRYDATTQAVDVKPLISEVYLDAEGTRIVESLPAIVNVPVAFPRGGGYRVTFPIAVGDIVLLTFSDKSLDVWLSSGGQVDPGDNPRFSLADAVAIPGLAYFANPLTDAPTDRATFGQDGGPQIHVSPNGINIGTYTSANLTAIARADRVDAEIAAIRSAFNLHTHPTAPTGPVSGPSTNISAAATVGSSKHKVEK